MRESAIDRLYQALATLMRRRPELSADVHPDFSLTGYTMLREVEATCGTRATDLADLFGLDKSTVSRQLDELEAAGLIRREAERPGRRGQAIALTSDGQRRLEVEAEQARQHFSDRLTAWKNRDLTAFAKMVERFLDDISK
jgi:DNA-binding MarR family transcriptional regulator